MMKTLLALTLAFLVNQTALAMDPMWTQAFRNDLQRNPLGLDQLSQSWIIEVYSRLNFVPQITFEEDQHKIAKIVALQQMVARHGLNPSDYQLETIATKIQNDAEREVRLVLELLKIAQDLNVGRVDPSSVSNKVRFTARNFERAGEVARLIQSPTKDNLDAFAPRYEPYWDLVNALEKGNYSGRDRERIALTLEKFRWLPDNVGPRYLYVNTSNSTLTVVDPQLESTSPIQFQKVINGRFVRPTYSMLDKITAVVLNPAWTPGSNILINDKVPALMGAFSAGGVAGVSSYLDRNDFELLVNEVAVDASAVDWANINPRAPSFRLRQRPGDNNVLGKVKILMENESLIGNEKGIWLHDTDDTSKFKNADRLLSSGCIRVEHPLELAAYVLEGTSSGYRDLVAATSSVIASPTETRLSPAAQRRGLPVIILHNTAHVVKGQVRFSADVYGEDAGLKRALSNAGYGKGQQLN